MKLTESKLRKIIKEEIQKLNEANSFIKLNFNSHKKHNPSVDILEGYINSDAKITYYINIKGKDIGNEGMEYYTGPNYVSGASGKSFSRHFTVDKIPSKYKNMWLELKKIYEKKYK
jgi:hypothetical protein